MSAFPKAQQRPLRPVQPLSPFAQWCMEGQQEVHGTIQQPNDAGQFGYIKPNDFPEERLYFSFREWPDPIRERARQRSLQGRPVIFDVDPQQWRPDRTLKASNVRLA